MNSLTDVLKSPSVWTGKDGVTSVTDLLKNPSLQDKIQFGLMRSSFDTLVKTGEIVTPGTDLKMPTGQLYDADANAGNNLISASSGVVSAPRALSSLASGNLSNLSGALSSITSSLPTTSGLANRGSAELGGLLATASKFGVDNAVAWAKGSTSATDAISGAAGPLVSGASGALSGALSGLTSGLKTEMNSLAKQGQFAVNFSDFKLPAAVSGIIPAPGFKGTVDRSTLNAATAKLIGSDKIPLPNFSPQSVDTSALTDAANKARGLLSGGLDASNLLSKATDALNSASGLVSGATSAVAQAGFNGTDPTTLLRLGRSPDPLAAV